MTNDQCPNCKAEHTCEIDTIADNTPFQYWHSCAYCGKRWKLEK